MANALSADIKMSLIKTNDYCDNRSDNIYMNYK